MKGLQEKELTMVQKRFSQMMRAPLVSDKTRMPKHCPVCGLWHIGHDPATTRRLIGFRYGADSHS